jgi:hypothetical protein
MSRTHKVLGLSDGCAGTCADLPVASEAGEASKIDVAWNTRGISSLHLGADVDLTPAICRASENCAASGSGISREIESGPARRPRRSLGSP